MDDVGIRGWRRRCMERGPRVRSEDDSDTHLSGRLPRFPNQMLDSSVSVEAELGCEKLIEDWSLWLAESCIDCVGGELRPRHGCLPGTPLFSLVPRDTFRHVGVGQSSRESRT